MLIVKSFKHKHEYLSDIVIDQNYIIDTLINIDIPTYINIISGKYLVIAFLTLSYLSYSFINDKIVFASYTSDSYEDYILIKIVNKWTNLSKFDIHFLNNKILHPITLFLQNL